MIQIIIRIRSFCKNLSILRIHHDHSGILTSFSLCLFILVFFVKCKYMLFYNTLHLKINCWYNSASIIRFLHSSFKSRTFIQIPILPAICSIQNGIIWCLYSITSHISIRCKSDYITCQCLIRILPCIIFLQPYALHIRIMLRICCNLLKFLRLCIANSFFQDNIPAVRILLHLSTDCSLLQTETLCQYFYCRIHILFVTCYHFGIDYNIIYSLTCRKFRTVTVYDISTFKWNRTVIILLLIQHDFGIFFSFRSIDISNPPYQENKS